MDARDKLVGARRLVSDARSIIRKHVVEKVGDLRSVLPSRKRGLGNRYVPNFVHYRLLFKVDFETFLRSCPFVNLANLYEVYKKVNLLILLISL